MHNQKKTEQNCVKKQKSDRIIPVKVHTAHHWKIYQQHALAEYVTFLTKQTKAVSNSKQL